MDDTFKVLYLVGFVLGRLIRRTHFRRIRRRGMIAIEDSEALKSMTPLERRLAVLAMVGVFLVPVIYTLTRWLDFADSRLPRWVGAAGVATLAAGLWVQWSARERLGHNLTAVAVTTERQTLVTDGLYHYIRHPIFAGLWLQAIAQALLLHNWIAGLAGLVLFVPIYVYRVRREEQMMLGRFGTEYRAYMARTGRVIPLLWR